jgi:ubiquinone biosynthesis protein COQ9
MNAPERPQERPESDPDQQVRDRLADAVSAEAVFSGFSQAALAAASQSLSLPRGEAERLFPGGPLDVLAYVSERADARTIESLEKAGVERMKIRDRIRTAVRLRIETHGDAKEAVRRGLAQLALPLNAPLGLKLLYRTVDAIWYAAGDTSSDFNFYTKRATLAGVFSSTLFYWLNDRSEGSAATWEFLDRRIDDVMRFEKFKSRFGKKAAATR